MIYIEDYSFSDPLWLPVQKMQKHLGIESWNILGAMQRKHELEELATRCQFPSSLQETLIWTYKNARAARAGGTVVLIKQAILQQ